MNPKPFSKKNYHIDNMQETFMQETFMSHRILEWQYW